MATANMGMTLPTVGVTSDAIGEGNVVNNFSILDVHDHSSGKGAQVPSAGLNINADLSFAGFRPFNLGSATFVNQTGAISTTNKPCFYVLNGEAHFIDNSGNDVALTAAGSVAGAIGSISGLSAPASAAFSVNTFSWKSAATTYAKMAFADIQLFQASAGVTNGITLKSPNSLAASYTVTLPGAAPGSTQYLNMDSGGTIATATADTIAAGMTATGANAIAAAMTSTGANAIASTMTTTGADAILTDSTFPTETSSAITAASNFTTGYLSYGTAAISTTGTYRIEAQGGISMNGGGSQATYKLTSVNLGDLTGSFTMANNATGNIIVPFFIARAVVALTAGDTVDIKALAAGGSVSSFSGSLSKFTVIRLK